MKHWPIIMLVLSMTAIHLHAGIVEKHNIYIECELDANEYSTLCPLRISITNNSTTAYCISPSSFSIPFSLSALKIVCMSGWPHSKREFFRRLVNVVTAFGGIYTLMWGEHLKQYGDVYFEKYHNIKESWLFNTFGLHTRFCEKKMALCRQVQLGAFGVKLMGMLLYAGALYKEYDNFCTIKSKLLTGTEAILPGQCLEKTIWVDPAINRFTLTLNGQNSDDILNFICTTGKVFGYSND